MNKSKRQMAGIMSVGFNKQQSTEQAAAYWREAHAQAVARHPALNDYRQHHLRGGAKGLWPKTPGIQTIINDQDSLDGVAEFTFQRVWPLASSTSVKLINQISRETNQQFDCVVLQVTLPNDGHCFISNRQLSHFYSVVLISRQANVSYRRFRAFIQQVLCPALVRTQEIQELSSQVFLPLTKKVWQLTAPNTRGPQKSIVDAALVVGGENQAALVHAFKKVNRTLRKSITHHCRAILAHEVAQTYILRKDGRPTLPQSNPVAKPSLNPAHRRVPLMPRRALRGQGSVPFPPYQFISITGVAAEDVVVDERGRLIYGVIDGRVLARNLDSGEESLLCHTHGRPLGLEVKNNKLIICDAHKGLLQLNLNTGQLTTLVQYIDGVPLRFCSNATMAEDGTLWFTESTTRFDLEHYMGALYEQTACGRLFQRDPDGKITTLLEHLYFPNGLTLTSNEDAILFVETLGYRLSKLWLKGPKAGKLEILAENLPGFPDNVSRFKNGRFWVAMANNRNIFLDLLGYLPGFIRKIIWKTPESLHPKGYQSAWVMAFDENGKVLADLQSTALKFKLTTGVAEHNGKLYLGCIDPEANFILELDFEANT